MIVDMRTLIKEERDRAEKAAREKAARGGNGHDPDLPPDPPRPSLPFIDMSRWDDEPAPPREWAVEDRIPLKQPYLFTGHGAVGKSLVELMRAIAHVLGKYWLGIAAAKGPVVYFGAEDEKDELHRRLADILRYYDATFADVIAGGLHLLSYAGEDCMLAVPDRRSIIRPTPLFEQIKEAAIDINPVAVMIDTVSDVFGGNEIDRGHVTQFIKQLQGLAMEATCSVSILAHPSIQGMTSGSGLSGSTGWHNKVRARAYMKTLETPKGEEPNPDLREIQFLKNNYGRQGDSIQVRWQRGVYVLESAPNSLEKLAQDHRDDERFLELLKRYDSQGRKVSDSKTANNYAPKQFAEDGGDKKTSMGRFEQAMKRLFTASKIHVHEYGRPSRPSKCIAPGAKP
jgi:RecA-family ATPase